MTWTSEDRAELEAMLDVAQTFGHWNTAEHVRQDCLTCKRVRELLQQHDRAQFGRSADVNRVSGEREG